MLEGRVLELFERSLPVNSLFEKWILLVLVFLYIYKSSNFYQLQKDLKKITPKVLSSKLKHLEQIGLIGKKILVEHPLRVEYYLTSKGEEFVESILKTFNPSFVLGKTEKKSVHQS